MEAKVPIRGWIADGYKDASGEIPLHKDSFICPTGWEWDEDWEICTDTNVRRDAGLSYYLEEYFEYEQRLIETDWEPDYIVDGYGDRIDGPENVQCPKGWEWKGEWILDTGRACDEDGWDYSTPVNDSGDFIWSIIERPFHSIRRRRMVRNRKNINPRKLKKDDKEDRLLSKGWEYAATSHHQFHSHQKIIDLVRRRKWIRKMVPSGKEGAAAIFKLNHAFIQSEKTFFSSLPQTPLSDIPLKAQTLLGSNSTEEGGSLKEEKISRKITRKIAFNSDPLINAAAKERKRQRNMPAFKIFLIHTALSQLQLRAYIYQGRDLVAMDKDSFSDPVVYVSFLNQCRRTSVSRRNLNPVWDETLMMDITFFGDLKMLQKFNNKVTMEIMHEDTISKAAVMGRANGKLTFIFDPDETERTRLGWLDLVKGDSYGGSILAAFELYLKHENHQMPLPPPRKSNDMLMVPNGIRPVLQRTGIEFFIWGVRNMQPYKLIAVDTPIVVIQIGNIEVRTKTLKNLKKNPYFSQQLYYAESNMPVDELYFPPIVIRVKDNRKFGRRPTVGQRIISDVTKYRVKSITVDSVPSDTSEDGSLVDEVCDVKIEVECESNKNVNFSLFKKLKQVIAKKTVARPSQQVNDIDWWSKYYFSMGVLEHQEAYIEEGLDAIKIYKNELEKQENFNYFSDVVETFRLSRGVTKEDEESEFAGEFKGSFRIYGLPDNSSVAAPIRVFGKLPSAVIVDIKIRIYVIRGFDLAPQDSNGLADPYLKVKIGKKRIDDRSQYIPNTLEPVFGRMFELDVKIPIEKDLHVQVYDWDLIGTDDKIGETIIDLENRYLTKFRAWCGLPSTYYVSGPTPWRDQMTPKEMLNKMAESNGWGTPVWNGNTIVLLQGKTYTLSDYESNTKPSVHWGDPDQRLCVYILKSFPHVPEHVEMRPLFSKVLPGIEQGRLHMWVDMFPSDYGDPGTPFNISTRKPSKYFVRVIIWNCSDIPLVDTALTGDKMTDIYFKGWISGLEHQQKKTDVNYRSMDGTGMFNWRFIFPIEYLPQEKLHCVAKKEHHWSLDKTVRKFPPVLNIQAWDNDLFLPNEYISEVSLALHKIPRCSKFKNLCTMGNLPDMHGNCRMEVISLFEQKLLRGWWPLYKILDGERKLAGKVEMSLEVVTEQEHQERPAGLGHDEPNLNPKLDKPIRPATSFAWFTSPLKSLRYIIWRKYRFVIIGALLVIILLVFVVLFVYAFPVALSQKIMS